MKFHRITGLVLAAGLALAACGGDDGDQSARDGDETPTTNVAAEGSVRTAESELGTILVDAAGRTLYGFTNDAAGTSTCEGPCTEMWPPVVADAAAPPAEDLDASVFSTVSRTDGTPQLKAGKWPVYLYAGDSAPGDVNGQGSGGVWFVIAPDGSLIKPAS